MRILTFLMILVLTASYVQAQPLTNNENLTYAEFISQFSQECQPHARSFVTRVSLAIDLFNNAQYEDAGAIFNRVNDSILALMISNSCTLKDQLIMMDQSVTVRPIEDNINCVLRVTDAEQYFTIGRQYVNKRDMKGAYDSIKQATYTVKELIDADTCKHLSQDFKTNLEEIHNAYLAIETQILEILEINVDE